MSRPLILIIDDEPDRSEFIRPLLHSHKQGVEVEILHPRDVKDMHLSTASVIVVDHYLDDWEERDGQIPSLRIKDGIALAAALRSQVSERNPQPAIVIRTARLEDLRGVLPIRTSQHLIAWQYDVEWVLPRANLQSDISEAEKLIDIVKAVVDLTTLWSNGINVNNLASDWLGLGQQNWVDVAVEHVVKTHPPVHLVAKRTHGTSILRWFLHRILPYPTFLVDEWKIAAHLGVTQAWLVEELSKNSKFRHRLDEFQYKGAFNKFDGRRWWRAGLSNFLNKMTNGKPFDSEILRKSIHFSAYSSPDFLSNFQPVLAINPESMQSTKIVNVDEAVRIIPDGWPTFADDAWALIKDIEEDKYLAQLVIDRHDLDNRSEDRSVSINEINQQHEY